MSQEKTAPASAQDVAANEAPAPSTSASTSTSKKDPKKDPKKDATILPSNTKGLHTVFIHKLYNMLEDDDLKHLIWWSKHNDSFFIAPGEEFSKALPQYFKHTNVASFVRQLNMYGFHKVSDNNSTQASNYNNSHDLTTWEFRHSSGNFKKGDIDGLKTIKRRSSKHGSSNPGPARNNSSSHLDLGSMSDTDYGSERSNSVTDLNDLGSYNSVLQTPTTSQYSQPNVDGGNSGNSVDPLLNIRLAELGHNLAALRHEHARLQLKYDIAIEDIRKTNVDMVHLLELVQKIMQASQGDEERLVRDVESDIANFKNIILQRTAVNSTGKDFNDGGLSFSASYQSNGQIPRSNPSKSSRHNETHSQQPQSPNLPSNPVTYPYPYPFPTANVYSQQTQSSLHEPPHPTPFHQLMQDPFQNSRKASSSRTRNMSIYDPLQPGAPSGASPSTLNISRNSLSGPTSNPDTNMPSPQVNPNGGHFSDYKNLSSHSLHFQNPQFHDQSRQQRPGSFPSLIPSVQHSLRHDSISHSKKRHSSNDIIDYNKLNIPANLQEPHHYPEQQRQSSQQHQHQHQHQHHSSSSTPPPLPPSASASSNQLHHPQHHYQGHQHNQHHQPAGQQYPNSSSSISRQRPAVHDSNQVLDYFHRPLVSEPVNRFQSVSPTADKGQKRESVYSLLNPEKVGPRSPAVKKSRVR